MAVDINLLPRDELDIKPEVKGVVGKLKKIAFISLILTLTSAVSLFAYGQALISIKSDTTAKIRNLEATINSYRDTEVKLVLLTQKIKGIKEIISSRPDFSSEMVAFAALLPPGATVSKFEGQSDGKIDVTVNAENSDVLDKIVKAVTASKRYQNVEVVELSGSIEKGYKFTLSFNSKEGKWL